MKIFIITILTIIFNSWMLLAQDDLFFPLKNQFDWKDIEKQDDKLKEGFVKNLPEELAYYKSDSSGLLNSLHVIDFNNDGLNDIIFDGWSGGELKLISIYINKGKIFKKVFSDVQGIYKIIIENNKVIKIYIQDWGCCCEYVIKNKVYKILYTSDEPKIILVNQSQFLNNCDLPQKYFNNPQRFNVINDNCKIRITPQINDTTEFFYCGKPRKGNDIGVLKVGSMGLGLAQKVDTMGNIWWFVAMDPKTEIMDSQFNKAKNETKSYKLGWVYNRLVKVIE